MWHNFLADEHASGVFIRFYPSPLIQVCFCFIAQVEGDACDRTKFSSLLQIHNANDEIFATGPIEEVFVASPKPGRTFELILGFDWPDHLSKRQISSLSTVAKTIFKFWNHQFRVFRRTLIYAVNNFNVDKGSLVPALKEGRICWWYGIDRLHPLLIFVLLNHNRARCYRYWICSEVVNQKPATNEKIRTICHSDKIILIYYYKYIQIKQC